MKNSLNLFWNNSRENTIRSLSAVDVECFDVYSIPEFEIYRNLRMIQPLRHQVNDEQKTDGFISYLQK